MFLVTRHGPPPDTDDLEVLVLNLWGSPLSWAASAHSRAEAAARLWISFHDKRTQIIPTQLLEMQHRNPHQIGAGSLFGLLRKRH